MNTVTMATVIEEVTSGKVIRSLYEFQGYTILCLIKINNISKILLARQKKLELEVLNSDNNI